MTDNNAFKNYLPSIFDDIVGFEDIKKYFQLAIKSNDPLSLWMVGPPACAKSLFLEKLEEIGGRLILGSKLTKNGLIEILFEEQPVLLCLDEIEKVKDLKDLSPLLTWIQDGRVKSDTGKERRDFKLTSKKWMVFAASNSIKRFQKDMPELLSRFEVLKIRAYQKDEFEKIVCNVLTKKEGIEKPIALQIAYRLIENASFNIREAQNVARLIKNESNPYMSIKTVFDIKNKYKVL